MMADKVLGNYTQVISARSTDREILRRAHVSGIKTQLLVYALEEGIIDGAIVAGPGSEPWMPEPLVATTREEIMASQGSKYSISPNVGMIKEATRSYGLERIAIVGVPCQVQAARKVQLYPVGMRDVPDKIALVLGIFCMAVYPYQSIVQLVEDHAHTKLGSVRKMDFSKGKFLVYPERGGVVEVPIADTRRYEQPGCHVCLDFVGNLADISAGAVGSSEGWSTVFVRTKAGLSLWEKAVAAGCFEIQPMDPGKTGIGLTTRLATEKIARNQKTLDDRATMGVGKGLRNPYV
jgi:coenzyme F420 hydrogenase subunit beta